MIELPNSSPKFGLLPIGNEYGMSSIFHVTLSLTALDHEKQETWECIVYECDDISENEVESRSFDNGKIAVEYFVSQIIKLNKK